MWRSCFHSLVLNSENHLRSKPFLKLCNFDVNHLNSSLRELHVSLPRSSVKPRDRKDLLRSTIPVDQGTEGEHTESLDANIRTKEDMFIDERTPDLLFNGIRWAEIPVCHLHVTKNNTIMTLSDYKGKVILTRSCGMDGFKNSRKGTNIAAQTSALSLSQKALGVGVKDVRIKVDGVGPGRMAAIKGLEMGGLNIVSVTDDTKVPWRLHFRPRKVRRL